MNLLATATLVAGATLAQEHRELGVHEHGVGRVDIAFEGNQVALALRAPGADIVGFEHTAESAADRAAVDAAVARLAGPLALFVLPEAAGCTVTRASAQLVQEAQDHDDHNDEEHAHGHDDDHDEHEGEVHAAEEEGAAHSEFEAEYLLTCADPAAITRIDFAYFEAFPNAHELEVQLVSDKAAWGFEVERDAPVLDLVGVI